MAGGQTVAAGGARQGGHDGNGGGGGGGYGSSRVAGVMSSVSVGYHLLVCGTKMGQKKKRAGRGKGL